VYYYYFRIYIYLVHIYTAYFPKGNKSPLHVSKRETEYHIQPIYIALMLSAWVTTGLFPEVSSGTRDGHWVPLLEIHDPIRC
jgi:hypothetical protein